MTTPFENPIPLTRPMLPDLGRFYSQLLEIWHTGTLTNCGVMHERLESALTDRMRAPVTLLSSGTFALCAALEALGVKGEVITTPFTFPATVHAIAQRGCTPVFCDIGDDLTIDAELIETLITPSTSAILPVHVFGRPCNDEIISDIARRHGLKLIYDAAHAFDCYYNGTPIAQLGDASAFSFHATKLFHTAEGGAATFRDERHARRARLYRNFGIESEERITALGLNGKLNELSCALGLLVLGEFDDEFRRRRALIYLYNKLLEGLGGIYPVQSGAAQYYVIRVVSGEYGCTRDDLYAFLRSMNVYARKYFYPLVSTAHEYRFLPSASADKLPLAQLYASQTLALPLYGELTREEVGRICEMIWSQHHA